MEKSTPDGVDFYVREWMKIQLCLRFLFLLFLGFACIDQGTDAKTDRHTQGKADGKIVRGDTDGNADGGAQAHTQGHIVGLLFRFLHRKPP